MSSLEEIRIELKGIGDILANSSLAVPRYQRSYAWEERHVKDLFQDLKNAIEHDAKEYFLGTIVVSVKEESRPELVDGQQRLATTSILLGAIRDYFFDQQQPERVTGLETYLSARDLETLDLIPRLALNASDHDFYANTVLTLPNDPKRKESPTKDSHRRIARAAQLARTHVTSIVKDSQDPTKQLVALVNYIRARAKVIWVRVPDDTNAFSVFETLNDRGLRLAISDLLKNYLFSLSGNRIDEVQEWWIAMTSVLEAVDSEEMIVTYIRQFWSSKYGLARERELYQLIKNQVDSKQLAVELAKDLSQNARRYAAMLNAEHELWEEYGATAREHMATLNDLGMVQLRPLLLAILDKFTLTEARKCLRLLVSWSVRFLIVGGLGGGALETHYCGRAVEIRAEKIKTAAELLAAMEHIVPTDKQFESAFEHASVSKDHLARYYLRVLERQRCGESEPELTPNGNEDVLTLEHVLPENPSAAWQNIEPENARVYYRRIGNMALLAKRINEKIGNKGFLAKRPYYKDSQLELTRDLAACDTWQVEDIEKRQKYLAGLAVLAWPNKA